MDALDVGDIRANPCVLKASALTESLSLQVRAEVIKRVGTGVVVVLILPQEAAESEYGFGSDHAGPRRRNVKRLDLRTLIARTERSSGYRVVEHKRQAQDRIGVIFLIVGIGVL